MHTRVFIAMALICALALSACSGTAVNPGADSIRDAGGIKVGNFEVVRYGPSGMRSSVLNSSLDVRVERAGEQLALTVALDDTSYTTSVIVDVLYDASQVHPVSSKFYGLLGSDENVLSAALLNPEPGWASVGQAAILDYNPGPLYGDFATIYFAKGAAGRNVSAGKAPKRAINVKVGDVDNMVVAADTGAGTASVKWYGGFNQADGDQNSMVNLADITPIAQNFNKVWKPTTDTLRYSWVCVKADYSNDSLVALSDLTPIAQNFANVCTGFKLAISDNATGAPVTTLPNLPWTPNTPANTSAANGTLAKAFSSWTVNFSGSTTPSYETLAALDQNGNQDGVVNLTITPYEGSNLGITTTAGLAVPVTSTTITGISLGFSGSDTWEKAGSDYVVLVTELSADNIAGNAENFTVKPFAPESLNLVATCATDDAPFDGTNDVIWYIDSGSGLATVGNGGGGDPKGLVRFKDRGKVTISADAPGNFSIVGSITFRLYTIDSLALTLNAGGVGPTSVSAGATVPFKVTGTFDFDSIANSNEYTQDLTSFCNWGALVNPTSTPISLDSAAAVLDTAGAASGAQYRVTCEYPRTDNVTLFDNMKRYSNFLVVNIT